MKKDQPFTPKYWVVHNIETDDVFLETASKTRADCEEWLNALAISDEIYDTHKIILIEIKEVKIK